MDARLTVLGEVTLARGSLPVISLGHGEQAQLFVALAERPGQALETNALAEMVDADHLDQQLSKLKARLKTNGSDSFLSYDKDVARLDLHCAFDLDDIGHDVEAACVARADGRHDKGWALAEGAARRLSMTPFRRARASSDVVARWRGRAEDLRFDALLELLRLGASGEVPDRRVEAVGYGFAGLSIHPTRIWSELVDLLVALRRFGDAVAVCKQLETESTIEPRHVIRRLEEIRRVERQVQGTEIPQLPLPPLAHAQHEWMLVDRQDKLKILDSEWARVAEGGFRSVVLVGEPGSGKSRIVYEVAHRYHAKGANVLMSPVLVEDLPCRPVVAALRHLFEHASDQMLDGVETWVLQMLRSLVGLGGQTPFDLTQISRTELLGALHDVLGRIARERPLVLILEDLHKADQATADLLRYLVDRQPPGMLLLGTWAGLNPPDPYREMELRVELLDRVAHAQLVQQVHGEVDEEFARSRYALTGGSPFLTVSAADLNRIDAWIRGLCERSGDDAYELLRIAAIYGPTFDPVAVEELAAEQMLGVAQSLEFAVAIGLLNVDPTNPTRYQFSHSLIRKALRDAVPVAKRARLSAELVPILRQRGEDVALIARRARLVAELNFLPRTEAARAGLDAALHASERGAHSVAIAYLESTLDLALTAGDPDLICEVGFVLGMARWREGDVRRAHQDFDRAAKIAHEHGRARWEVEIALAYGGPLGFKGVTTSSTHIALLQRALEAAAGIDDERAQIRLQAALAGAWTFDPEQRVRSHELADFALTAAERSESPELIAEVLTLVCWTLWSVDDVAGRRELADRLCTAADQSYRDHLRFESRLFRLAVALTDGDLDRARRDHRTCAEIGARSAHHTALLSTIRGAFALLEGRLDAAEIAIHDALDEGRRDRNPAIFELYAVQMLMFRRLQGRVDTLRAASEGLTDEFSDLSAWKGGLGTIYVDLDRRDDARRCLEALARDDFVTVSRDLFYLVTLEHATRIAHYLGDEARARQLHDLLSPYADQLVVAGGAAVVYGVVEHSLGLLAETFGDADAAVGHLERALARHTDMRLRPASVLTAFDLARVLDKRRAEDDAARAGYLRDLHRELADQLGIEIEPRPEAREFAYAGPIGGKFGGAVERVEREALKAARLRLRRLERASANAEERHWGRRVLPNVLPQLFRPGAACGWTGRIQVIVRSHDKSEDDDQLLFDIGDSATVTRSVDPAAETKITLPLKPFLELLIGSRNSVGIWLDGTAEVDGDPTLAARLIEMFAGERLPTV